jgi:integrase
VIKGISLDAYRIGAAMMVMPKGGCYRYPTASLKAKSGSTRPIGPIAAFCIQLVPSERENRPLKLANKELRPSDPPVYMIFLLGVAAGLRRKEIDLLEWSSFRFNENAIRVEPTLFFHPKSQDSIAEIHVDPEIMAIFRQYHAKAKGSFVIPSGKAPKTVSRGDYYRCESHFDVLNAWLRSKGVNTQKPLHTLRKEYGSLINKVHGIHAASKALRHADISVTNNFYTDSRVRVTPGLGKLFRRKTKPGTK